MNKLNYIILAVMILTIAIFSGCSLVTDNKAKYMSQTVAEIELSDKNKISVSMEEFLIYYSNYASNYLKNGSTAKEATEKIIDMVLNRKLFVDYLKSIPNNSLTTAEINDCWTEVYKYIDERLDSYKNAIYNDLGKEIEKTDETTEEKNEFVGREDYKHNYLVKDGELVKQNNETSKRVDEVVYANPFKSYFWQDSEKDVKGYTTTGAIKAKLTEYSDGIKEEEMKRFVKDLKKNESYKTFDDNSSMAIFERELNRVFDIQIDNKFISNYEETFKSNYTISKDDVLSVYKSTLKAQKELYVNDISAYNDAMKSDATKVYYHPTNSWFYVSHLLISYTDEQKELIKEWEDQVKKGVITEQQKEANIETLRKQLKATARDSEGKNTDVVKSAEEVLNEVDQKLAVYGSDNSARINAFTDLIYKYTAESSFLTREYDYAIPLDKTYDTMVSEFASASRDLHSTNRISSYSRLVYTEYGAHIIMYTGVPTNVGLDFDNTTIQDLANVTLKSSSTKNMLDLFISKVTTSDFNVQQAKLIDQLRDGKKITVYKSRLGDYLKDN